MGNDFIVGIYNYYEEHITGKTGYYIIHLFGNSDALELAPVDDVLSETLLKDIDTTYEGVIGPFTNLSEMNQFVFAMCEISSADWVGMISVKEYNQVLDSTNTLEDYKTALVANVNVMENINKKNGSKNIIKKMFS